LNHEALVFSVAKRDINMKKNEVKSKLNVVITEPEKDTTTATSKKAESATAPSIVQSKNEVAVSAPAAKAKPQRITAPSDQPASASPVSETPTKKPISPRATKKMPIASSVTLAKEMSMHDRVGLTAGAIWHYLADNGPCPVDTLIKSLSEESTIIQRSIGWLAQENKVALALVDGQETIALTQ